MVCQNDLQLFIQVEQKLELGQFEILLVKSRQSNEQIQKSLFVNGDD